jgi:hypothetical protein
MDRKVDLVCLDNQVHDPHPRCRDRAHRCDPAGTKAALVAAKANGKKLGNYRRTAEDKQRGSTARAEAAIETLNRRGVRTASSEQ